MNESVPNDRCDLSPRRCGVALTLLIVALVAAMAPTLRWPQLTGGNENIVAQTALEMRHGGEKFVPTMMGEPRVKKPPLVAWITAATIRSSTLARLNDRRGSDAAYVDLAFEMRWTGLLAGCITVLATFEMGRLILGNRGGLLSAVAVSSGLLFLKYMRQTTSDVHLAMWVTIANALLLHGLLRGRWWLASIGGGFAVGMAFLCKGPVSLVETVVPLLGGLALMRGHGPGIASGSGRASLRAAVVRGAAARWAVGVLVFVVVATPWFFYVYFTVPHVWHTWFSEVTREGATDLEPGRPWMYLLLGVMTWPWVIFGVLGWVGLWLHRRERRLWLPVLLALLPLAVMVWFRDRKERYMLPMIAPAAVMCGYGLLLWIDGMRQRTRRDWAIAVGHFLLLGGGALALAYLGTRLKTVAGDPWYSKPLAGWCAAAIVAWVGLGLLLTRRRPGALVVFTFIAMLGLQALFMFGYARSGGGRSNFKILADIVRARAPTASVYDWLENRHRIDEEFAIYLNRPVLQADPATIVPVDRPAVVIVRQRPDAPPPELPAQWRLLGTMKDHKNQWFAFVRYPEPGPGSNS